MRIGLDFDDTLTDFSGLLTRLARERCGVDLEALRGAEETLGLSPYDACAALPEPLRTHVQELIGQVLTSELTLQLDPHAGAVEVTQRLARAHELIVVTVRDEHESAMAQRWLQRHGIPVAQFVHTNRAAKSGVAREQGLAVLLDDSPHTFEDFVGHPTVPALYLQGWHRLTRCAPHVRAVEHWDRFEALVEELADGATTIIEGGPSGEAAR